MAESDTIQIKLLMELDEMAPAVALQHTYWGADAEGVIPAHMLFSLAAGGGHVLAAFAGQLMVGLLVGFLGTSIEEPDRPAMANLQFNSKRMIVHPDFRGAGIGYKLKLAQRKLAIKQGVRMITWTFDPVLVANAHLNIRKLGAVCSDYKENYYGTNPATGLVRQGMSDRLAVEWWVTHRRVEERLHGSRADLTLEQYLEANTLIVNPAVVAANGLLTPPDQDALPVTSLAMVEVPLAFQSIETADEALAKAWRLHLRRCFKTLFGRGFIVTDFLRAPHEGRERAFYLMSYNGPQFETYTLN